MPADLQTIAMNPYIVAIIVYLLALVGVGIYKGRQVKDSADFMVAGRTLPWYILVGTLLATWIGNGSLFGGAGLGYRNGFAGLWANFGAWAGIILVYFIAQRIRTFGKVTVPDIFEARYNSAAGILATITTIIAYLTIVSYQFRGGGRVLNIVTDGIISVEAGIIITAVFAITYTVLAGMISVVYTDVVNGILMIFGVTFALGYLLIEVGGIEVVVQTAEAAGKWSVFGNWADERAAADSAPIIAISFLVPTMLLLMGDANMYQRIFSAKDGGSAKKAVAFWIIGVIFLESSIAFLGLTGSVAAAQGIIPELFPGGPADTVENVSENIIPTVARLAVPTAIGMALVATMMAIIVSTADSFLLVPATNLTRDVYQRYVEPNVKEQAAVAGVRVLIVVVGIAVAFVVDAWWLSIAVITATIAAVYFVPAGAERRTVFLSRFLVLLLGYVAFMLVDQFPTILAAAYTAYLVYGAAITPALLAAFLWKRATKEGAVASILLGTGVTLLWTFYLSGRPYFADWHPFIQEITYPAVAASVLGLVTVSLLTPKPPPEAWEPFYKKD